MTTLSDVQTWGCLLFPGVANYGSIYVTFVNSLGLSLNSNFSNFSEEELRGD